MPDNIIKFVAKGKESAEILIYGDIGWDVTAKTFGKELAALGKVSTIDVRINSYGGDVFDGIAIYSRLVDHSAKITSHVDGIAASAASVIAMAGDTVRISSAGMIMIHDAWGIGIGNATDFRALADRLEKASATIAGVYEQRTGNEMDQVRAWMEAEYEFDADEAIQNGFATEKFAGDGMVAKFDPERHHFRHKPAAAMPPKMAAAQREMRRLQALTCQAA